MKIEYSVARIERDGTLRQHASLACWPEPEPARIHMQWMNTDLYRAMQEQAAEEGPESPFSQMFHERFEGTQCAVVSREVGDWEPVVEMANGSH